MNDPEGARYWRDRMVDDVRRDWRTGEENWIAEYAASTQHPHRQVILDAIASVCDPPTSVFETGCNAGPNLARIHERWPNCALGGLDINARAVEIAKTYIPSAVVYEWNGTDMPTSLLPSDIVLADAVLMYVPPQDIERTIAGMARIAWKGIVLCEWYDDAPLGAVRDGHWARNYPLLLQNSGFAVERRKLTKEQWPTSDAWVRNGEIFIARKTV